MTYPLGVKKTESHVVTRNVNTGIDAPVRGSDVFQLWVNPKAVHYRSSYNGWEAVSWSTSDGGPPKVLSYSADQLIGTEEVPSWDSELSAAFANLTASDRLEILAMNAPLAGQDLDPERYQLVDKQIPSHVMRGPGYVGAAVEEHEFDVAYDVQYNDVNGSSVNAQATVLHSLHVSVVRLGVTETWTENFTEIRADSTGTQQAATITLATPTVGCVMEVEFYIDAVFGTYFVKPIIANSCL